MSAEKIFYRDGYKYVLVEPYVTVVAIKPEKFIFTQFVRLDVDGTLSIAVGYAYDGPSGPAIDTKNFMRGSLVHDALYQLMREGFLDRNKWRVTADEELKRICLEDGMSALRAWWVFQGVRFGGGPAATSTGWNPTLEAP